MAVWWWCCAGSSLQRRVHLVLRDALKCRGFFVAVVVVELASVHLISMHIPTKWLHCTEREKHWIINHLQVFFFVQSIIVAKFLRFLSPHFFAIVGWFCIAHVDLCWSMICLFLDLSLIFLIASFSISRSMRIIYAEFTCTFFRLSLVEDFFNPNQKVNFQTKTNFELSDATWDDFFIC